MLLSPDEHEGYTNYSSTCSYEIFPDSTFRVNDRFDIPGALRTYGISISGKF